MPCWASVIGGCGGGLSREHVVSDALLEGDSVSFRGFPWCKKELKAISPSSATAKILCVTHNNALSDCDRAAQEAKQVIKTAFARKHSPTKKWKQRKAKQFWIDGGLFARWICKTACNSFAVCDSPIPENWVRYSFGCEVSKPLYPYMKARVGLGIQHRPDHIRIESFTPEENPNERLVRMLFYGFEWLLCEQPLSKTDILQTRGAIPTAMVGRDYLKPTEIKMPEHDCRIRFRWPTT